MVAWIAGSGRGGFLVRGCLLVSLYCILELSHPATSCRSMSRQNHAGVHASLVHEGLSARARQEPLNSHSSRACPDGMALGQFGAVWLRRRLCMVPDTWSRTRPEEIRRTSYRNTDVSRTFANDKSRGYFQTILGELEV